MKIALGSIFRNSNAYLERYWMQIHELNRALAWQGDTLRLILAEGDSIDGTWRELSAHVGGAMAVDLFKREHGGQQFRGSPDNELRWKQISYVCDGVLEKVAADDDVLIYVESDIIWDSATMLKLLAQLQDHPAVTAMCFHQPTGNFYDTWGFRKNKLNFMATPPYHPALGSEPLQIDSAGSVIVMRSEVARVCRFKPAELGIVGFGRDMKKNGFELWLDPSLKVLHP